MKTKEKSKIQLDILKDKLHRMLDDSNGIITDEIVKISQALDEIIIQETERHNYAKKNNTTHE
ncbi:Spo0E family sporulation regulatory protein-aspartic acid phosphatase [Alkaliphilus sp. MSJ-5]|uniref:Spo0E family sporulation regulatory protein-aspartic acid phosphatase n=1 Tax=Alkaliphilus flagellatus TaxID=2841507 RepID=A0ABS6G416_9FIRM|nr:Spo0E family sporulation regulatory protein-aspartic acid phosphatase [Alkaliphilus flagellatus]MBU5677118.1 Spo0E family sporulation regulatory protein-aspartic acid phosphatase [Alkaliphilus flagellatus]